MSGRRMLRYGSIIVLNNDNFLTDGFVLGPV